MTLTSKVSAAINGVPLVSVIVPHYNDLAGLRFCHDSLVAQTWPSASLEIIVVDNNSSCGLEAVQQTAKSAIIVDAREQGAGPARNAGVAASHGTVIAFLDSDCRAAPDWLVCGVASLAHFDFTGGEVVVFPERDDHPTAVEAFEMVFNFDFRRYIEKVGFTGTGNMFVWRHVFDRVGGFRADVSEDVDWSMRARRCHYRLGYAPDALVMHPARRTWDELEHRWERLTNETFALKCEQRWGRSIFLLRGLMMALSIIPHAVKIGFSSKLRGRAARLRALGILCRLRLWRARRMLSLIGRRSKSLSAIKSQLDGWS